MAHQVLCFLFNRSRSSVVLLQKQHPEWQRGKFNGPGGTIEGNETVSEAASREMQEETGLEIVPSAWREFASLEFTDVHVHCVETIHPDECPQVEAKTSEIPTVLPITSLPFITKVAPLDVLVHLARADMQPVKLCPST